MGLRQLVLMDLYTTPNGSLSMSTDRKQNEKTVNR